MNKLEILNSMPIVDYDADGEILYYAMVEDTKENRDKLREVGVTEADIIGYISDNGNIDISQFAFRQGGAGWYDPDHGGWLEEEPEND